MDKNNFHEKEKGSFVFEVAPPQKSLNTVDQLSINGEPQKY